MPSRSASSANSSGSHEDELPQAARIQVVRGDDPTAELIRASQESDLVILGLQRLGRRRKSLGTLPLRLARESSCPADPDQPARLRRRSP